MTAAQWTPLVEIYAGGRWREVTPLYLGGGGRAISITRGQRPEALGVNAAEVSATLINSDATYTPRYPLSSLYGLIGRNTPMRVAILPNATEGDLINVTDTFTRTVINGWGTPDTGNPWTLTGSGTPANSDFQVASGAGTMYVPAANAFRYVYQDPQSILDCTQRVTFTVAQATGGDLEPASLIFRGTTVNSYVLVRPIITTGNAVQIQIYAADTTLLGSTTVSGLTHTGTGQPLTVEARTVGRDIFAKVWITSGSEPVAWDLRVTDPAYPIPGFTGLRSGRAAGNTNATDPQFSYDNYTVVAEVPRAVVEVPAWPTTSDKTGRYVTVALESRGILSRLLQGRKPLLPALVRTVTAGTAHAFWPLNDVAGSSWGASLVQGQTDLSVPDSVDFAADSTLTGVGGAPRVYDSTAGPSVMSSQISNSNTFINAFMVAFWMKVEASAAASIFDPIRWTTAAPVPHYWIVSTIGSSDTIVVNAYDADSVFTTVAAQTTAVDPHDGEWHHVAVHVEQTDTSEITTKLWVDGTLRDTDVQTGTGYNVEVVTAVHAVRPGGAFTNVTSGYLAGLTVTYESDDPSGWYSAGLGYPGETAAARLARLCGEVGVPFALEGTAADTTPMGPQREQKITDLLSECATADGGVLFEPRSFLGLAYRTRTDLINQASVLDLDYTAEHFIAVPIPMADDLLLRNMVIGSRPDGGTYTYEVTDGPLSTSPPPPEGTGAGIYDTSVDLVVETDTALRSPVQWLAHQGTVETPRFPRIEVHLGSDVFRASQDLSDAVRAVDVNGPPVTATNLPVHLAGEPDASMLAIGLVESLDQFEHTVEINGVPDEIWSNIGVWDSSASRWDSSASTVTTDFDAGTDTSLSITVEAGSELWVTGSGAPEFPFHLKASGVVLNVTAISGASSPQTATVDATPVNGIVKTIPAGTPISLADPVRWGY